LLRDRAIRRRKGRISQVGRTYQEKEEGKKRRTVMLTKMDGGKKG